VPRLPNLPEAARVAFEAVRSERILGSCTLLLAQLHMNTVSILNFGDCGVICLRPTVVQSRFIGGTPKPSMRLLYRTSPMMHRPNLPFQLSSEDDDTLASFEPFDLVSLRVRRGDILVAGTDGLYDNISERELTHMALEQRQALAGESGAPTAEGARSLAAALAAKITRRAADVARVPDEFGGGGKLDDIAVVVACVEEGSATVGGEVFDNFSGVSSSSSSGLGSSSTRWQSPTSRGFSTSARSLSYTSGSPFASQRRGCAWSSTAAGPSSSLEGAIVRYRLDGPGGSGDDIDARVGRLLGQGSYALAYELLPSVGGLAVLKAFRRPDPALAALFGRGCAQEVAAQYLRERRAGEALRLGPASHPGFPHVAQLLSAAPRLERGPTSNACDEPAQMLVHEHAGEAIGRPSALARLGFACRVAVVAQLMRAAALLRLHGIVHADINAENICVDGSGRARIIDFGNAVILEGSRDRAQACERLAQLRTKYLHHPRFPPSERYSFPMSVGRLIADVERPRGIDLYSGCAYDPEMLPGNLAATPPEALRGTLHPGASDVYGLGVLLWWFLTGEEAPFEIDITGDRASFVGWASFYKLTSAEQVATLRGELQRKLLPELRGGAGGSAAPDELDVAAGWLCAALAEVPEQRPRAGTAAV